jgi:hypothetical protein
MALTNLITFHSDQRNNYLPMKTVFRIPFPSHQQQMYGSLGYVLHNIILKTNTPKKIAARSVELRRHLKIDNNYFLHNPSRVNIQNHFYISTSGYHTTFQDGPISLNNLSITADEHPCKS